MTKGARKELLFAVEKMRDVWYNKLTENLEFVGACNEPNRINSQERYFTNI